MSKTLFVFTSSILCYVLSFHSTSSSLFKMNTKKSVTNNLAMSIENQKNLLAKAILSGLFSVPLVMAPHFDTGSHSLNSILIEPANAEFRAAQKRTYFRFVPKLIEGRAYYKNELKAAIDGENWDVISKFFETYVSKYNPNDPNQIDATDSYVNVHFYRPMTVFSGSFAERGSSTKQRLLLEQIDNFKVAMDDLEGCVKDRTEGGFFGKTIKMPTGKERKIQAQNSWTKGKEALNSYIKIANDGLMLELSKIDTI